MSVCVGLTGTPAEPFSSASASSGSSSSSNACSVAASLSLATRTAMAFLVMRGLPPSAPHN